MMRLVASNSNSKPVPEAIRGAIDEVSVDDLREIVERISTPRAHGTPETQAVRRIIFDLLSASRAGRVVARARCCAP